MILTKPMDVVGKMLLDVIKFLKAKAKKAVQKNTLQTQRCLILNKTLFFSAKDSKTTSKNALERNTSLPLNNTGLNCAGPLICNLFFQLLYWKIF